ncbi:MAG: type II 3-dehydroquinate dehydratase [Gemmatimonadota bacterium]|nr:MAG: type II 3-dehydroquinate dehydratase [Gemmatimonadota bacterium]
MRIAVVHGPNLRLLGRRQPDVYGTVTLDDINVRLVELAAELGTDIETFQSNSEGEILDFLEEASGRVDGFVVNAGGLTHSSIALRDGLVGVGRPFVEVHLSNTAGRERFRRHSFLTPVAIGAVLGFGVDSYLLGLRALVAYLGE